jgi:hypothetical protein
VRCGTDSSRCGEDKRYFLDHMHQLVPYSELVVSHKCPGGQSHTEFKPEVDRRTKMRRHEATLSASRTLIFNVKHA